MKKITKVFTIVTLALSALIIAGCKDNDAKDITKVEFLEDSINTVFELNTEISFSNAKFKVTYSNDSTVEVTATADTTTVDNTTEGVYDVIFTLDTSSLSDFSFSSDITLDDNGKYSVTIEISIVEEYTPEGYIFADIAWNDDMTKFRNTQFTTDVSTLDRDSEKTSFITESDSTKYYYIGTANEFQVPLEYAYLVNGNLLYTTDYGLSSIDLYMYDSLAKEYKLLESELSTYASVDAANSTIDFTDSAVGEVFKIVVTELVSESNYQISLENISVIKGYNIYTANELSVINNYTGYETNGTDAWQIFKENNNIPTEDVAVDGVILHSDISLTTENIPSYFIETKNGVDSLLDRKNLYTRHHSTSSDEYNFIGNYFNINASAIPVIQPDSGEDFEISQTSIFGFGTYFAGSNLENRLDYTGDISIKNLSVTSNAQRSETMVLYGGLNIFTTFNENVSIESVNMLNGVAMLDVRGFDIIINASDYSNNIEEYVRLLNELTLTSSINLKNVRSYDAFSNIIYIEGAADLNIVNSDLKDAGGPIINGTDVTVNSNTSINTEHTDPSITIDDLTQMESLVTGQEAWFQGNNATAYATQILAINTPLSSASNSTRSLITSKDGSNLFNFVIVIAPINLDNGNGTVNGSYDIAGSHSLDTHDISLSGYAEAYYNGGAPVFVSNNTTLVYDNAGSFFNSNGSAISSSDDSFFADDKYIDIHVKVIPGSSAAMTIVCEYFTSTT